MGWEQGGSKTTGSDGDSGLLDYANRASYILRVVPIFLNGVTYFGAPRSGAFFFWA